MIVTIIKKCMVVSLIAGIALFAHAEVDVGSEHKGVMSFSRYSDLGITAYQNGDYAKAVEYYKKALGEKPNDAGVINNLALVYLKMGNFEESERLSFEVRNLNVSNRHKANAQFNLGKVWEAQGYLRSAVAAYRAANRLSPSPVRERELARMSERYEKALDDFSKNLRRHGGSALAREKIDYYLTNYQLEDNTGSGTKEWLEYCASLKSALKGKKFEFVTPDIVVDDWFSEEITALKKKYSGVKFGMGYESGLGPKFSILPTWNITIYKLDVLEDEEEEVVIYGERTIVSSPDGESRVDIPPGLGVGYMIFNSKYSLGVESPIGSDPSSTRFYKHLDSYNGLYKLNDEYFSLMVNDFQLERGVLIQGFTVNKLGRSMLGAELELPRKNERCDYTIKEG